MKKASIVVPIYNVEKYLQRCLDSLINQTYENIEIILVNDGSTDGSGKIARKYCNMYQQIILLEQENGGLSRARNAGIKKVTGDYICFVDSDDWLELNTIKEVIEECEKKGLDICIYGAWSYYSDQNGGRSRERESYHYSEKYQGIYTGKELFAEVCNNREYKASSCMYLLRRDLLLKNGLEFRNGILHEDELFTPYLFYYANRVEILNKEYYGREIRPNSITTGSHNLLHMMGYGEVFLGLAECPGIDDEIETVAYAYKEVCKENLQQCLNYFCALGYEDKKRASSLLKQILMRKKSLRIKFPFIYYLYLIKVCVLKKVN